MERVSGMGGSPEGQRSPGRLGILQEGNLKAQEHAVPICQKTSWRGSRLAWLKKEVWLELKKKKVYGLWKKWQATQEDCKGFVKSWRETIRRAKAQGELSLAVGVVDNKNVSTDTLITQGGLRSITTLYWM